MPNQQVVLFHSETASFTNANSRPPIFESVFSLRIAKIRGSVTIIGMSSGRSFYQRRPDRYATEKKHFQRLIYKLKRLAVKRGYTKNQIAT
jgi:hypothetical protein